VYLLGEPPEPVSSTQLGSFGQGKNPWQKPAKDLIKSFGKRRLERKDIQWREAFQLDTKRFLKSLSKAWKNPGHMKTEKAFLRDQERERNRVALHLFLRERWR
jgi:hypothetical protein